MADILSQDEVDLLLGAVSEGDIGEAEEEAQPDLHLSVYDFRRPERVSKEQLKGLQSLFEAFSREISIIFPPFLRTVVRVDLTSIDQLTYDEFILSVARPTALSIIDMSPLEGTAVIEMSPSMVFPIVDRVLGGKGLTLPEPRELTEIENRIIQRIVMMILDSLRRSWEQLIEFRLSVLQQESDPLIVQIVAGSEMVILVGYEVHIGETVGTMNFCIPLVVLNPILDQISQQVHYSRRQSDEMTAITQKAILRTLLRSKVSVEAILGRARMSVQDVASLSVGDVIQLDTSPRRPLVVELGGRPKFLAQPGRRRETTALQVLDFYQE
ncbi:MAG: flagellar motor switch protein FliM [Candidatus Hydrogenedentes bacterium]|nr:flagellar motor switch protein FliM [Candidatus Hydrogenedentota bacterium]